jgi:hypothetical protein
VALSYAVGTASLVTEDLDGHLTGSAFPARRLRVSSPHY